MNSHLSRGKLNVGLLQEQAKNELLTLIDKCDGSKVIVWDDALSGPFGLIAEYSLLKTHDAAKMYVLRPGKLNIIDTNNVIFITRPLLKLMNCIAQNIHSDEGIHKKNKKWHIFFVPNRSLLCEEYLKNKGVYGSLTNLEQISSCTIFPFDSDLMSMEVDTVFKDYYIDGDTTYLFQVAETITMLEKLFGPVKRISGKGNAANHVMKLLSQRDEENSVPASEMCSNVQIDHLVLIDRSVDFLSALATQLTYSGLIDEFFGINNCTVKVPAEKFIQEGDSNINITEKQLILNSGDEVYAELCDKHFSFVGPSLTDLINKNRHAQKVEGQTIQQLKEFVAKVPQFLATKNSLKNHTTLAELIKEAIECDDFVESLRNEHEIILDTMTDRIHPFIEECMARKVDMIKVLRLICIQSVVNGGLKPGVLEQYKRDIVMTYGFHHLLTLTNLEKVGLLKVQQSSRPFTVLRKTLKLIVEETSYSSPKDIHFVHGVYAPLTARLAQQFSKPNGIRYLNDVQTLLPGLLFDKVMNLPPSKYLSQRRGSISSQNESSKVTLVFFIGGCTYSEVSALRFLSQQEETNVEFVIATTKLINGDTFIKSLVEPIS